MPSRRKTLAATRPDCASAFQTIGLGCLAAIKQNHRSACTGDAESVHQIRIGITRLRAAASFFAPIVIDPVWLRLKKEIAWLNGPLGAARDSDVMLEHARHERYRAWAGRATHDRLDQQRMGDHRRLARALKSLRTKRLLTGLTGWLNRGPWLKRFQREQDAEDLQAHCARKLARWHWRLVRRGRHLDELGETSRHELRIKAKRMRYMLESLTQVDGMPKQAGRKRLYQSAKRLQRTLGDLRDLERFVRLADMAVGDKARSRSPAYRRRTKKLIGEAVAAVRDIERARFR